MTSHPCSGGHIPTEDRALRLIAFDELDSTNLEALRRAAGGERGPLWLLARAQTQGRGRSGRQWLSEAGNLAASYLFAPGCRPQELHQLSLLTGVAVWDAIDDGLGGEARSKGLRLKWPNDVLAVEAKLGGILVESTTFGAEIIAVLGIGINLSSAPAVSGRSVARLADLGVAMSPDALLTSIDARLGLWLDCWSRGAGFGTVRQGWLDRAGVLGEPTTIHAGVRRINGSFAGLDHDGALLLGDGLGQVERFTTGDVSLGFEKD